MTELVTAYQNNDINEFEKILKQNRQTIMEDTFIREHIEDLLKNIRTQVDLLENYDFEISSLNSVSSLPPRSTSFTISFRFFFARISL